MGFTPKLWKNRPDGTTPISAAALIDLETRLGAYADIVAPLYTGVGDGSDAARINAAIAGGGKRLMLTGAVLLNEAIVIPSNTTIILHEAALTCDTAMKDNIVRNADPINGNSNISIVALGEAKIDGANRGSSGAFAGVEDWKNNEFMFVKATGLRLLGFTIANWHYRSFHLEHVKKARMVDILYQLDDVSLGYHQGGVNIVGGDNDDITIQHLRGACNDDFVAIGSRPNGGNTYDGVGGLTQNVKVRDIAGHSPTQMVRILTGDGSTLKHINIDGVKHETSLAGTLANYINPNIGHMIYFGSHTYPTVPPAIGDIDDVSISNIQGGAPNDDATSGSVIGVDVNTTNVKIRGVQVNEAWSTLLRVYSGAEAQDFSVESVDVAAAPTTGKGVLVSVSGTTRRLKVEFKAGNQMVKTAVYNDSSMFRSKVRGIIGTQLTGKLIDDSTAADQSLFDFECIVDGNPYRRPSGVSTIFAKVPDPSPTTLFANGTNWASIRSAGTLDLILADVVPGAIVRVDLSGIWGNEQVQGYLDVFSLVGSTLTNSWSLDAALDNTAKGLAGWQSDDATVTAAKSVQRFTGGVERIVTAGDLGVSGREVGTLVLRPCYRTLTAATKSFFTTRYLGHARVVS